MDSKNCLDILLTNIQLHSQKARKPNSLGRQYVKTVRAKKTNGRAYSNDLMLSAKGGSLSIGLGMEQLYELARQKGKKYVRIFAQKDGLQIYLGKDTIEKIESLKRKHLQKSSKRV